MSTNTALSQQAARVKPIKELLESDNFQRSLRQTMPSTMDPKRLIRVVLSSFSMSPKLLECSQPSVLLSIMRAAAMGLEPDGGPLGQGYLVPYWSSKAGGYECQFIPGYRGLVKLARNSGEIADVWAEVVYERDQFDYELGLEQKLQHRRNDEVDDPGQLKYAYAVARFRDGVKKFVVMNRREVEKTKATSKSRDKKGNLVGPWVDWEEEMWKRTAVRRLAKSLPLSVETEIAKAVDDGNCDVKIDVDIPLITHDETEQPQQRELLGDQEGQHGSD